MAVIVLILIAAALLVGVPVAVVLISAYAEHVRQHRSVMAYQASILDNIMARGCGW